ncbi:MAG: dimethylarginine dimethylaminohydrolase family protein [Caulobacteraceae bacterium]
MRHICDMALENPTFLMTDPASYQVSYKINPWMRPGLWSADPGANLIAARKGWNALKAALEAAGAQVEVITGDADLPDMVFPANAAVVLDGKALLARFRFAERQGEEPRFEAAFARLARKGLLTSVEPIEGCFQEGAGDCVWDRTRRLFWVGSGPRSSPEAQKIIAEHFGVETIALPLASERFYHLDTCFCPLADGRILYFPDALSQEARANLAERTSRQDLIAASPEDAERFCVNAVSLGRELIMARPLPRLADRLADLGYRVRPIDLDPFILSGGAAFCLTLRLDLQSAASSQPAREESLATA